MRTVVGCISFVDVTHQSGSINGFGYTVELGYNGLNNLTNQIWYKEDSGINNGDSSASIKFILDFSFKNE